MTIKSVAHDIVVELRETERLAQELIDSLTGSVACIGACVGCPLYMLARATPASELGEVTRLREQLKRNRVVVAGLSDSTPESMSNDTN